MPNALDPNVVRDFAIALLIGALLGLDREKHKATERNIGIAGIRTFILFAQAGAVSAWLSRQQGNAWIFVATLAGVAALVIAGYVVQARTHPNSVGLTTEIAAIGTCLLGAMVVFGYPEIAVALAIVSSALLTFKRPLHRLVDRLGTEDLYAATKLLIATFVVLPLLPNRAVDPWGALNPYELWWLVILISTLSLAGYVAVRWLGRATGTLLTALFGGLVSSTAVTLAFARQSSKGAADSSTASSLAAGLLIAWTIMFARVVVEVAVVHAPLLPRIALALGVMGATALASAAVLYRQTRGRQSHPAQGPEVELHNPFSLSSAINFALLFAAVLLVVAFAQHYVPDTGVYLVAAIAGLTDVDAITLSMAAMARDQGNASVAAGAIVTAAITNTVVKAGLVLGLGSAGLARRTLVPAGLVLASGLLVLLLI